ncbi:Cullin binding-domain-containing protein [Mycena sanguinolenta]|nr:Cullin binding-domain-containing protein [Mycena sanguinolenta]
MPPKRKRAEDDTAAATTSSTRATRSSARQSTGSTKDDSASKPAAAKKSSSTKEASKATTKSEVPAAKKAKTSAKASTSTTKGTAKKTAPKKAKAIDTSFDQGAGNSDDDEPKPIAQPKPKAPAPTAPVKQASVSKLEPYSPDRAAALFKKYADEDDPNVIGPEGFSNMCTEAQIALDGAGPLILAWQINAKEMAKFTKDDAAPFIYSCFCELAHDAVRISSLSGLSMAVSDLETLLIQGKPAAKGSAGKKDPYDRFAYNKYAADPTAAFQTLYSFCFTLAKQECTSTAFWSVLLVPKYPIMSEVLEFIAEKGSYKATNKDLWSMMLEFCRTVQPSLHDYEADGAWPTLLDDFVAWKKAKVGNGASAE